MHGAIARKLRPAFAGAAVAWSIGCGGAVSHSSPSSSDASTPPDACSTSPQGAYAVAMTSVGGGGFPSLSCASAPSVVLTVSGNGAVAVQGPPALPSASGSSSPFVPWSSCTASAGAGDAGAPGDECPQRVTVTCSPDADGGYEAVFTLFLDASGHLVPCTDPTFADGETETCSGSYAQYASYCTAAEHEECCVDAIVCNWTLTGQRAGP